MPYTLKPQRPSVATKILKSCPCMQKSATRVVKTELPSKASLVLRFEMHAHCKNGVCCSSWAADTSANDVEVWHAKSRSAEHVRTNSFGHPTGPRQGRPR